MDEFKVRKWYIAFSIFFVIITVFVSAAFTFQTLKLRDKTDDLNDCLNNKSALNHKYDRLQTDYYLLKNEYNNLQYDYNYTMENLIRYSYHNTTEYIYRNTTIYAGNFIYDVNRDGVVDFFDSFTVYQYINEVYGPINEIIFEKYQKPIYDKLYDVNIDGKVNNKDYELIWQLC